MRKVKLFKSLLFSSIGILSLGTVAAITTSCNEPKPSSYLIDGGSLKLLGYYGQEGSDKNKWIAYKDGEEYTGSDLIWKITDPSDPQIENSLFNNDGVVSWTNSIEVGDYNFRVAAYYNKQIISSNLIHIFIKSTYEIYGGSTKLEGSYQTSSRDENKWIAYRNNEEYKDEIRWYITTTISGITVEDGVVSWDSTVPLGNHSFKVQAEYDGEVIDTETINLYIQLPNVINLYATGDTTFKLYGDGVEQYPSLSVSNDGINWRDYDLPFDFQAGTTIYLKANHPEGWNHSQSGFSYFDVDGSVNVYGSVMGIIDGGTGTTTIPSDYCFYYLFNNSTAINYVSNDFLPATELTEGCYKRLFCKCKNLTNSPELPVQQLALNCYESMFEGCSSLTEAQELPSTQLAEKCYYGMFDGCTSLIDAPLLPALELSTKCYELMFCGCSSLDYIELGYTGDFEFDYFNSWVQGVKEEGSFYYYGTDIKYGDSAIPLGWTLNPEL